MTTSPISIDDLRRMPGPEASAFARGILAMLQRWPEKRKDFSVQDLAYLETVARDALRYAADYDAEEPDDEPDDESERIDLIADILAGLYGDEAIGYLGEDDDAEQYAWDYCDEPLRYEWKEVDHPRGKGGRFIPKGSSEAAATAKEAIKATLKQPKNAETAKKLVEHLNILTVKQLHELKKEYKLSASGDLKEKLVAKLADRLGKGRGGDDQGDRESALKRAHDSMNPGGRKWEQAKKDYLSAGGTEKEFLADMERLHGGIADLQSATPSYKEWAKGERESRKKKPDTPAAITETMTFDEYNRAYGHLPKDQRPGGDFDYLAKRVMPLRDHVPYGSSPDQVEEIDEDGNVVGDGGGKKSPAMDYLAFTGKNIDDLSHEDIGRAKRNGQIDGATETELRRMKISAEHARQDDELEWAQRKPSPLTPNPTERPATFPLKSPFNNSKNSRQPVVDKPAAAGKMTEGSKPDKTGGGTMTDYMEELAKKEPMAPLHRLQTIDSLNAGKAIDPKILDKFPDVRETFKGRLETVGGGWVKLAAEKPSESKPDANGGGKMESETTKPMVPELTGSEKQISWAKDVLSKLDGHIKIIDQQAPQLKELTAAVASTKQAKILIDMRGESDNTKHFYQTLKRSKDVIDRLRAGEKMDDIPQDTAPYVHAVLMPKVEYEGNGMTRVHVRVRSGKGMFTPKPTDQPDSAT